MLTLTPEDANTRYRGTLENMESSKVAELGDTWGQATLAFYFGVDQTRAALSCRATLVRMLLDDHRRLDNRIMDEFLDSVTLEQQAVDTAGQIFDTYAISTSVG
jgi:hypothetical protein